MKFRRLPPLHTLEAFEVAARHRSFKAAAEQLHLTPSAVSHQLKALEGFLGFALFRRGNRSLELTEAGKEYLELVSETLARLREGSRQLALRHARAQLRISMGPFIANEILLPALPSFQNTHPDIDVRIDTSLAALDLGNSEIDVALRFGDGHWPALVAERLMAVSAVPVCAPSLAAPLQSRSPPSLNDATLIHSMPIPEGWSQWARATGITLGGHHRDVWLDSYLAILRAAEQGVGLALGLVPMVDPWLRSGKLVAPWPELAVDIPQAYYLLYRTSDAARPEILAFRSWLRALLREQLAVD